MERPPSISKLIFITSFPMKKKFQLWPAIDIIDAKPVRLFKGNYDKKTQYDITFSLLAQKFSIFADGIHVVDLDGAKSQKPINIQALKEIANNSSIPIEIGGGIRTLEDITTFLNAGAKRCILGTSALKNPDFLQKALNKFGPEKIIVGVDAHDGMVATHGWEESSSVEAEKFIEDLQKKFGVTTVIFTDIASDGTLAGPPLETFKMLVEKFPNLEIIASGGIANIEDIKALKKIGVAGCIFGKAYYEGLLDEIELKNF